MIDTAALVPSSLIKLISVPNTDRQFIEYERELGEALFRALLPHLDNATPINAQ